MSQQDDDDTDEALHPRETAALFGHAAAEAALLAAYRAGRMPHGMLITGPKGIGKATLAYCIARFIFSHPDSAAMGAWKRETAGLQKESDVANKNFEDAERAFAKVLKLAPEGKDFEAAGYMGLCIGVRPFFRMKGVTTLEIPASTDRSSGGPAAGRATANRSAGVHRPSDWCGRAVLYSSTQASIRCPSPARRFS